jgi:hypothetical protein
VGVVEDGVILAFYRGRRGANRRPVGVEEAMVMARLIAVITRREGVVHRVKEGEEDGAQRLGSRHGTGGGRRFGVAQQHEGGNGERREKGEGGRVGLARPKGKCDGGAGLKSLGRKPSTGQNQGRKRKFNKN